MADYFSFEDVMGELQIDEDELKRMVSEGELRAFRSENKMKFKVEDVENLKKGKVSEPTVILPSAPTPPKGSAPSETNLELDLGMVEEKRPTEELLPSSKTSHGQEPLALDEAEINTEAPAKAPDETFAEEEIGLAPETEPLKLAGDTEVGTTGQIVEEAPVAAAAGPGRIARRAAASYEIPSYVEDQIERRRAHWGWTLIMSMALLSSVAYVVFMYDVLRFNSGKIDKPSKLTNGVVYKILKGYWEDDKHWRKFHEQQYPKDSAGVVHSPPFTPLHREYTWVSYEEPDRPLSPQELQDVQQKILQSHGDARPGAGAQPQ